MVVFPTYLTHTWTAFSIFPWSKSWEVFVIMFHASIDKFILESREFSWQHWQFSCLGRAHPLLHSSSPTPSNAFYFLLNPHNSLIVCVEAVAPLFKSSIWWVRKLWKKNSLKITQRLYFGLLSGHCFQKNWRFMVNHSGCCLKSDPTIFCLQSALRNGKKALKNFIFN